MYSLLTSNVTLREDTVHLCCWISTVLKPWMPFEDYTGKKRHESPLKSVSITIFSRSWEGKEQKDEQFPVLEVKSNIVVK